MTFLTSRLMAALPIATWFARAASICFVAAMLLSSFPSRAQQPLPGPFLTASGATDNDYIAGVAMSDDGNTAVVASDKDDNSTGAAWVFVRNDGAWSQQGPKLVGSGAQQNAGLAVAMSGDGNTVALGKNQEGTVWIFHRNGTSWVEQAKIAPAGGREAGFGATLALPYEGRVVVVGAPRAGANGSLEGAAYIFGPSGGNWVRLSVLGPTPPVTGSSFGQWVAISRDMSTIAIGTLTGPANPVYVYAVGTGFNWTLQATLKDPQGGLTAGAALSRDGNTAFVAGDFAFGTAFVFLRSSGAWALQAPLPNPGGGYAFALSADGNTVISGVAQSFIFRRYVQNWLPLGSKVAAPSGGRTVGLSADGSSAILPGLGGAWVLPVDPPRTVWGVVNRDGTVRSTGGNFTLTRQSVGQYLITFVPPFANQPALVASQANYGFGQSTLDNVIFPRANANSAIAVTGDDRGVPTDRAFSFVATGN